MRKRLKKTVKRNWRKSVTKSAKRTVTVIAKTRKRIKRTSTRIKKIKNWSRTAAAPLKYSNWEVSSSSSPNWNHLRQIDTLILMLRKFSFLLVAQPIFGVSLGLAVVRSHCHDNVNLPLIVRDCIDYLQEYGLHNEQIYKVDVVKTKLQHLKCLYNNREMVPASEFDISTACSLLKLFIQWVPLLLQTWSRFSICIQFFPLWYLQWITGTAFDNRFTTTLRRDCNWTDCLSNGANSRIWCANQPITQLQSNIAHVVTLALRFNYQKRKDQQNEHTNTGHAVGTNTSDVTSTAGNNAKPLLRTVSRCHFDKVSLIGFYVLNNIDWIDWAKKNW